jgi:hypothetical protein
MWPSDGGGALLMARPAAKREFGAISGGDAIVSGSGGRPRQSARCSRWATGALPASPDVLACGLRRNGQGMRKLRYSSSVRRRLMFEISRTNRSRSACSRLRISSSDQ